MSGNRVVNRLTLNAAYRDASREELQACSERIRFMTHTLIMADLYRQNSSACTANLPEDVFVLVASNLETADLLYASQACRSWRCAIWNRPSLWTSVVIRSTLSSQWQAPAVDAVLRRSNQLPISVKFYDMNSLEFDADDPLDIIEQHMSRIVKLDLELLRDITQLKILQRAAPMLASFRLGGDALDSQPLPRSLFSGVAPLLETIALYAFYVVAKSDALPSVRSLYCLADDVEPISQMCPSLQFLCFGGSLDNCPLPEIALNAPTQTPIFQEFVICDDEFLAHELDDEPAIVDYARIPHLRIEPNAEFAFEPLSFVSRHFPKLEEFLFCDSTMQGRTSDGRVASWKVLTRPYEPELYRWFEHIRAATLDIDHIFRFKERMPQLKELTVVINTTSTFVLRESFLTGSRHPGWATPSLSRLAIFVRADRSRLGGSPRRRSVTPTSLHVFITHFLRVEPGALATLDLVNLMPALTCDPDEDTKVLESLADVITCDGLPYALAIEGDDCGSLPLVEDLSDSEDDNASVVDVTEFYTFFRSGLPVSANLDHEGEGGSNASDSSYQTDMPDDFFTESGHYARTWYPDSSSDESDDASSSEKQPTNNDDGAPSESWLGIDGRLEGQVCSLAQLCLQGR